MYRFCEDQRKAGISLKSPTSLPSVNLNSQANGCRLSLSDYEYASSTTV